MDYAELISQNCPSAYLSEARALNLRSGSGDGAIWDLMMNPDASDGCRSVVLGYLAEGVDAGTNAGVLNAFFTFAARTAQQHDPETMHRIAQAATRLRSKAARRVLESYADDKRRATGVSGPGATIAETVSVYLSSWPWK